MGKRTWLDRQLAEEYFPVIAQLPDTPDGHSTAIDLAAKLRQSWVDRNFTTLSQLQPLSDQTRSQLKAKFGADHFSLKYFGLTTQEYAELNDQKLQRTADRNEDVKQISDPEAIVAKAVSLLLESSDWFELAAALAVLTGRRSSELLATAKFQKASQWSVTFTGALKRGGERQILSFEIPTLTTSDRVIAALAKLRQQLPDAVNLPPEEINRKYGDRVAQACDRHFKGLVPPRGEDNLYTHLFRAVYATIATFWYCPPWVEPTEYKAAIQGHYAVLDADDPTLRRSLTASRHYADYEIADAVVAQAGGKRKGIKLGHGGIKPLQCFQRPSQQATPAPSDLAPTPNSQTLPTPVVQPSNRKRTPKKNLWIHYQDQDLAQQVLSYFGATDTTEAKIAAMSNWLRWSHDKLQTDGLPHSDRHSTTPSPAAASDQPDEDNTPAITAVDQPKLEPSKPPSAEPEAASQLNELKAMFAQTLQMFQGLMQAQIQIKATSTASSSPTPPAATTTPAPTPTHPTEQHPTPPPAAVIVPAPEKTTSTRSNSPQPKAETAALTTQILDAIAHIERYNHYIHQTQQPHRLKREITTNFLKVLTPNQRLINRILNEQQAQIQQHHQQMHIQPGHNSSYRERITLADIQQTLQAEASAPQN